LINPTVPAEVRAAVSMGPAAEAQPFYNPIVYHEIPNGMNAERFSVADCWLNYVSTMK